MTVVSSQWVAGVSTRPPFRSIAMVRACPTPPTDLEKGDINNQTPSLLYVSSHSSYQGTSESARTNLGRVRGKMRSNPALSRGSRMTVLYGDVNGDADGSSGVYGNRDIYSSFVAHPEAESKLLDALHSVLFGGSIYNTQTAKPRPNHAYGPCFGPPTCAHNRTLPQMHSNFSAQRPEERYCMGITSILPFETPYFGTGGRVLSISPHGVRVHTRGGMVMSDKQELAGMLCGELIGTSGSIFANVAGMSSYPSEDSWRRPHHVHCIDLQRDLKIVSSHTIVGDAGSGRSNGGDDMICVTDMASNTVPTIRSNLVVGCSDGTLRVLDGGRRNAEIAKVKGFPYGGVSKVAVSEVRYSYIYRRCTLTLLAMKVSINHRSIS